MSYKSILVGASLLLGLLGLCSNALAGAGPKPVGAPHSNWLWPSPITKMEVDMKVTDDPGVGAPLFYANQFTLIDANGNYVSGGYIGLQGAIAGTGQKGVMFSLWGDTTYTNGSATCETNTHEGLGTSCPTVYNWQAGKTYHFRIVASGRNYSAYVTDTSTQIETFLATIVAPAQNPEKTSGAPVGIGASLGQWIEFYAGDHNVGGCAALPYTKLHWTKPSGNGGAIMPTPRADHFEYGNVEQACRNTYAWADSTGTWHEHGNPGTSTAQQLISASGKYVYASNTTVSGGTVVNCGGSDLKVDSAIVRDCSQITRVALPSGKIALQVDNGYYLSCANGGGSTVTATMRSASTNESFTETTVSGKTYYQSANGKYLTAVNGGGGALRCDAASAGVNEGFIKLINSAPSSAVSVSSEYAPGTQLGVKAVDGNVSGYPSDHTREWAVNPGSNAGAWINLAWSAPITASAITLYDRPNTSDQLLSGALLFSDGSSVAIGALPNDGATGLSINFTPRDITSVKLRIDSTSGGSVGLAEFQVWSGPKFTCSEVTDTNANHVTAGRAYTVITGTYFKTTTWYANGSNNNLGTAASTSVKLAQTSAGYFIKGSCPAAPIAPTVGTPTASVSGTTVTISGTAADANNNLSKVEVEFDNDGQWITATGTTSWSLQATKPAGSHSARARATDATNLVSAVSSAVSFTTTNAPVCVTAKNTDHITAGRAHQCGTAYSPQACANGSNNNLGSSSTYFPATTSIQQQSANYWVKVSSCP